MKRVLVLAVLAACKTSGGDDFPVEPGGPGPGGVGESIDAAVRVDAADPDGMSMISGRVCLVSDLRALGTCATTGAGGITVTLGTKTATTAADGTFTITKPGGSNLVWRASGTGIVTSVMPFTPSTSIPAIADDDYIDLQNANSVEIIGNMGSIVARVVRNGIPQSGVVATVNPPAAFATKYDGTAVLAWNELATRSAGTVWMPGTAPGSNVVTVTPASGTGAMENVLVEDQAITYITIDLP